MAEVSLRSLPICISLKTPWRRERRPTPVFWPGKFHGLYSLWGHKKSGTTEGFSLHGDNLVTRYKAKHALWLFSDTKSISISNLAGCAYIWSMNLQGREEGCRESRWIERTLAHLFGSQVSQQQNEKAILRDLWNLFQPPNVLISHTIRVTGLLGWGNLGHSLKPLRNIWRKINFYLFA